MLGASEIERIVARVAPGGVVGRSWRLRGGVSAAMTAIEIAAPDGVARRIIVRRPPAWALPVADEFRLLGAVRAGGIPAPPPVALDASGEIVPEPYLVVDYVEGTHRLEASDVDGCLAQLARQLARIHDLDRAALDLPELPDLRAQLGSKLQPTSATLDASMQEARVRDALSAVWPLPHRNGTALLHGDFWPGNVLWNGDEIAAVLDWEDAGTGDPILDLAISRLDVTWVFGLDAVHAFTDHYRSARAVDLADLPYWDLCAAFRSASNLAAWSAEWPALGRPDITEQTMTDDRARFVEQAFTALRSAGSAGLKS